MVGYPTTRPENLLPDPTRNPKVATRPDPIPEKMVPDHPLVSMENLGIIFFNGVQDVTNVEVMRILGAMVGAWVGELYRACLPAWVPAHTVRKITLFLLRICLDFRNF